MMGPIDWKLGVELHEQGKLADALTCLEEAVRLDPTLAEAHNALGAVLTDCGDTKQAEWHLREAIRLKVNFVEALKNLGMALEQANRFAEAMECFQKALTIDPGYAVARNRLAHTLVTQGRIEEAVALFQETLTRHPDNLGALVALCYLAAADFHRLSDAEGHRLQEWVSREHVPADDLSSLHHALAELADRAGNHDAAFHHIRQANEGRKEILRRRGISFDLDGLRAFVDRTVATFTPAFFEQVRALGSDSKLPVFIVGMMRSGTTLAEQILASHPQIHGAGELGDVYQLANALNQRLGTKEDYPECLTRVDAGTARLFAEGHLQRLKRLGGGASCVVDKRPLNYLHLGLVATLFPRARIIHCRRNVLDTCLSCYFQDFALPHPHTLDLRHLGQYYREYERLMAHWARVLPVPVFELRYEELTADPEAISRRLVAFCGLEWDERCLRFNDTPRMVRTASKLQVRRPMYRSSVGRWKAYERHLQPLFEALKGDS